MLASSSSIWLVENMIGNLTVITLLFFIVGTLIELPLAHFASAGARDRAAVAREFCKHYERAMAVTYVLVMFVSYLVMQG